jgi:hypothetical protein
LARHRTPHAITTDLETNTGYINNILDSYIAINTLIIYINKLNTLTLIFDTVIKNKKNNNFKIILKVQVTKFLTTTLPPKNWCLGQL